MCGQSGQRAGKGVRDGVCAQECWRAGVCEQGCAGWGVRAGVVWGVGRGVRAQQAESGQGCAGRGVRAGVLEGRGVLA